jgi:hypothetical protein
MCSPGDNDDMQHAHPVVRKSLFMLPFQIGEMSLCLFTWGWLKTLLALFFFSPLKMAIFENGLSRRLRQPLATGSSDYRLERGKRKKRG